MKTIISEYRELVEDEVPHSGRLQSPNATYTIDGNKVIARLKDVDSARYTRLGRNLKRMEWLAKRMDHLKEQTKQESRELVADLFHAEDANKTRLVETMGFIFQLTKDPERATTIKYAKVLEELQSSLTPELLKVMEALVAKHSTLQKAKPAGLSAIDKRGVQEESIKDWGSNIKNFLGNLLSTLTAWGKTYDEKLDSLKSSVGLFEALVNDPKGDPVEDVYYPLGWLMQEAVMKGAGKIPAPDVEFMDSVYREGNGVYFTFEVDGQKVKVTIQPDGNNP